MRLTKLLLTAVFGLALVGGIAACSTGDDMSGTSGNLDDPADPADPADPGSGNTDPGKGAAPGAGSGNTAPGPGSGGDNRGGAADLESALNSHGDTERVALEIIEDDCGTNATCLEQLQTLATYIEEDCGGAGCAPSSSNFLSNLTPAQRQGVMPATFPQVKDIKALVDDALGYEEPADGGDDAPAGDDPAAPADPATNDAVNSLVDDLRALANTGGDSSELNWDEIMAMLGGVDANTARAIRDTLEEQFRSAANDTTANSLLEGDKVDAGDAADTIEAAWAEGVEAPTAP